jgi:hypothetical protein
VDSSVGKTYDEIWKMFVEKHHSVHNSAADLRRIHLKWKWLAATTR